MKAACSNKISFFIVVLGFILQSIISAGIFHFAQEVLFFGLPCFLLLCTKLFYADDAFLAPSLFKNKKILTIASSMRLALFALLLTSNLSNNDYKMVKNQSSSNITNHSYVLNLNDGNFEQTTQISTGQTSKWFIYFYSSSCKQCQSLFPKWSSLSRELKELEENNDFDILLGSVNITENPILAERFGIGETRLPTLLFFADGMFVYPTPRNNHFRVKKLLKFIVGGNGNDAGYKQVDKLNVPKMEHRVVRDGKEQVYVIKALRHFLDDAEQIILFHQNAAVALVGIGMASGISVAAVALSYFSCRRSKNSDNSR